MKTIKYFVAFLSAALLFSACEQEQGLSQQNKDQQKPSVSIVLEEANDVTLSFAIAASENAAQYAYAVFTGTDNDVPSAYDILLTETFAVADGAYNTKLGEDAAFSANVTIDCSGFAAENYQIFGAAITETGLVGEVTVLDVTMNDTTAPALAGADVDVNVLTLQFNEAVKRGNGKAYVSVIAWGVMQFALENSEIAEEDITVEGNVLTIVCPEAPAGAGYYVSYDEGIVTDLSGNKCAAIRSGLNSDYSYAGLGWDTDTEEIPITAANFVEPAADVNWGAEDANIVFVLPTQVMTNTSVKNAIQVIYSESAGVSQLYADWTLGDDFKTVTVYLPKMPTGDFDVCIKAGAFYDAWGNMTSAFEPATLRYSNYLVDLKLGYYAVDYAWDTDEGQATSQFLALFEKVDNTTVLMSADWFELMGGKKLALPTQMVGTVDYSTSTITFDGTWLYNGQMYQSPAFGMGFYQLTETEVLVFFGGGNGADPIVIKFDEDGYLTETSYFEYGLYSDTYLGAYSYCPEGSKLTFLQSAEGAPATKTTNAKAPVNNLKLDLKGGFTK